MQPQLFDACNQFEQVFLASLLPQSIASFGARASEFSEEAQDEEIAGSGAAALFAQTFAAALQRAGGLGLAGELYRSLSERSS